MPPKQRTASSHHGRAETVAPLDDRDRLETLESSGLLDSPPQDVFDRAVTLATSVLGTPVGLLSLVDGERQFFKAQFGLPEPYASERGTPLSHSFCQHVVASDAPLIVQDAREDPILKDNAAIPDLGVIAYLGVPVRAPEGHVLGSFCAIDTQPRDWTDHERRILENIASGVESEIALRLELVKRTAAERVAENARERLELAIRAGRLGTFDFDPASGRTNWDAGMYQLWWIDPEERDPFPVARQRIHPKDRPIDLSARNTALDPLGPGTYDAEFRIVHPHTGDIRWIRVEGAVTFAQNIPTWMVGTARDVTLRREAQEQNRLLTLELNHRVKNLFAITSGMIGLTARASATPADMGKVLRGRITALAKAHELIQPAVVGRPDLGEATTLESLTRTLLQPHVMRDDMLYIQGPAIALQPRAASSLALVLHELGTNAAKYGALSVPDGTLTVSWTVESSPPEAEKLSLTWREAGHLEDPSAPPVNGFGSSLIDTTVNGQLNGYWRRTWKTNGMVCRFDIPMAGLAN